MTHSQSPELLKESPLKGCHLSNPFSPYPSSINFWLFIVGKLSFLFVFPFSLFFFFTTSSLLRHCFPRRSCASFRPDRARRPSNSPRPKRAEGSRPEGDQTKPSVGIRFIHFLTPEFLDFKQGSLKNTCCNHLKHVAFSTPR